MPRGLAGSMQERKSAGNEERPSGPAESMRDSASGHIRGEGDGGKGGGGERRGEGERELEIQSVPPSLLLLPVLSLLCLAACRGFALAPS